MLPFQNPVFSGIGRDLCSKPFNSFETMAAPDALGRVSVGENAGVIGRMA